MSKSLATKNVAGVLVAIGLVLAFSFSFVTTAKADALSDLQAQVNALLAQIAALQAGSATATGGACFTFTQTLTVGSTGGEVMEVQKFLNSNGAQVSVTGAGSPGNESSYFGAKTKAAVAKFQAANGVSPAVGYWGPLTRAKANSLCVVTTAPGGTTGGTTDGTGTVTPVGPGLTVTAGTQPANSLAPQGASRVPFTTFTLSNNTGAAVTVNGITIQRAGLGVDANFSGIVLVDDQGLQVGIAKTLNSNHQATIGDTFTLDAGASKTYTVAGNMAASLSSYTGQIVSLSVVGVNTSVPVNGSLPITGAQQTINSTLTVGSVTTAISSLDPNSAQSKNIGDTGLKFSGLRFTAGSAEDLKLFSVRWRLNGTVSANDLANIVTVVSGTSYPTTVSSDGRYFTAVFPGGILITKGNSIDVTIQGDVIGTNASGRVAQFDVDKTSDVYFVGQLYGYGVAATVGSTALSTLATHASALTASTPWFQGSTFSISGASVTTIAKATSVPAQNVAVNVSGQPLGGYVTNFTGEAVSVQSTVFSIATSSGQSGYITNVSIYDENGVVVAGPVDASGLGDTLTFTDTITYPTGLHTYTIKGKVPSTYTNGGTIQLSTAPVTQWTSVTGQTTGNTVTLTTTSFTLNTMTVRAASLTMGLSTTPSAQTIVAGGQAVTFANIQLDASQSGEDVRVNSIPLYLKQAYVVASGASTNLTTCQINDAAGNVLNYGSNVISAFTVTDSTTTPTTNQKVFSLNNSLTIPKGTVVTLTLKCNVGSSATAGDAYTFGTYSAGTVFTFTGVTSGNSANTTVVSAVAGTQTIAAAGTVTVSADSSSPSYVIGAGGATGVTAGVAKFRPANEAVNLTKIGLTLAGTNGSYSGASGAQDLVQVYIYNGSTLVGTATFTGNASTATSTLLSSVSLARDVDTKLTVKVDLADVGTSQPGNQGDLVAVDILNFEGQGASSGSTVMGGSASGLTSFAGTRLLNTYPTVAQGTLGSSGAADGKLLRFSVTANAAGDVGIGRVTVTIATSSGITIAGLGLYAYTDSGYSTPISGQGSSGLIGTTRTATSTSEIQLGPSSPTSPVEVPAGATYYFELRGSVGGVTTGSSITTTLLGDSSYSTLAATSSVTANFVWSPNATTTSNATHADWTSGYSVIGLPSGGLIQTRGL
ncbi:MAG: peptidoglycan-binding domain-containing protein [bacterium]|nr:peptidoglycan-binding domain-containing protein [bacterium]